MRITARKRSEGASCGTASPEGTDRAWRIDDYARTRGRSHRARSCPDERARSYWQPHPSRPVTQRPGANRVAALDARAPSRFGRSIGKLCVRFRGFRADPFLYAASGLHPHAARHAVELGNVGCGVRGRITRGTRTTSRALVANRQVPARGGSRLWCSAKTEQGARRGAVGIFSCATQPDRRDEQPRASRASDRGMDCVRRGQFGEGALGSVDLEHGGIQFRAAARRLHDWLQFDAAKAESRCTGTGAGALPRIAWVGGVALGSRRRIAFELSPRSTIVKSSLFRDRSQRRTAFRRGDAADARSRNQ